MEHVKAVVGLLARHTVFLCTRCVSSYCDNPTFTVCLQAFLSVAVTSQESVFMPSAWRFRLHTSLKRSWGRPVGLFPVASSPYKRSFGMRPSFIHVTCPSHRMRLCFKRVYKLGIRRIVAGQHLSGWGAPSHNVSASMGAWGLWTYKACVISTLLYGSESWTMCAHQEKRLNVFYIRLLVTR